MKKIFITAILISCMAIVGHSQQINLGPTNPQVKGILGQDYGGTGSNQPIPDCHGPSDALSWNASLFTFGCNTSGGGGGVSSVSAASIYMFTLNVASPTTTPVITVTFGNVLNQLYIGTGAGTGVWTTIPDCEGGSNALTYNNTTQAFSCPGISGGGGGTTTHPVTFAASGGSSAGATFNGASALTVDYHTIGAPSTTGTGASGTWGISLGNSVTFAATSGASPGATYNGGSILTVDYLTVGAPSVTGSGASGTWGINISGTAVALASAPTTCSLGSYSFGIGTNGNAICSSQNISITLPSGTPISALTCTGYLTATLVGTRSTSAFNTGFGTNPLAVAGWGANGGLVFNVWPDASNDIIDWSVCNQSNFSITPGAETMNVGVK
jgi:hypothetical protein